MSIGNFEINGFDCKSETATPKSETSSHDDGAITGS